MTKAQIYFIERKYPSANMVLIKDKLPTLIDTGFGSDVEETEQIIRDANIAPEELHLIVNTHYHSDHVGGNYHFQKNHSIPIAAHKWDAELVNACDHEVCSAEWLDQPVEPYRVDRKLSDKDKINTGSIILEVFHTPGHTLGHISLFEPEEGILICGDLFHKNEIGWINIFREGVASIQQSLESLDRLSLLPIEIAYSGHGPQIENPMATIDISRKKFEKWLTSPEKVAWYAIKRIFAYTLMIKNGIAKENIEHYLLQCPWFQDFARHYFQLQPDEFIPVLLNEMLRSGAATWNDNKLIATTPFNVPQQEWLINKITPRDWKQMC